MTSISPADILRDLYAFNAWGHARIFSQVSQLSKTLYFAKTDHNTYANIHDTLAHTFAAEYVWFSRVQAGVSPPHLFSAADFISFTDLKAAWDQNSANFAVYLNALTDEECARTVTYTTTEGEPLSQTVWQILHHVIIHGMQHRAELAAALTTFGYSPGNIDYIIYLREAQS